ncbi:MAG: hypothetical protein ACRCX2_13620 [Paraclostridium sp.]
MNNEFIKYSIGLLVIDSKANAHILDYRGKLWDHNSESRMHLFESPVFPERQTHFSTIEDALNIVKSSNILIEGTPVEIDLRSIIVKEIKFNTLNGIVGCKPLYRDGLVPTFI